MASWMSNALESRLQILPDGPCQLCGADTQRGLAECIELAGEVTNRLKHSKGIETMTIFLCVDAHALQHPEIHKPLRGLFHLSRLKLILEDRFQWEYGFSPVLNQVVNEYKRAHAWLAMEVPPVGSRGAARVTDLPKGLDEPAFVDGVWKWSEEIYNAYENGRELVADLATAFRQRVTGPS